MSNDIEQSYTDIKKKRILSILPPNLELNSIATCKLYTSGIQGKKWLFSDLDGLLCFLLDYQNKTRCLALFDSFSFEKLFQYELYNDFGKAFIKLADDFRAFEVDNGFIGLQFDYASEANQFDIVIKKCEGNFLRSLFESKPFTKKIDPTVKMKSYAKTLKELFCSGDDYDENYAEDGTEIIKARSFEMLNNISYNKDTKQFEIGEISEELRRIFIAAGLRKKDLINDLDFAFHMFKQIILGVSENKDLLYTDFFHKQYGPPVSNANNRNNSDDSEDDNDDDNENRQSSISSDKQQQKSLDNTIKSTVDQSKSNQVNKQINPLNQSSKQNVPIKENKLKPTPTSTNQPKQQQFKQVIPENSQSSQKSFIPINKSNASSSIPKPPSNIPTPPSNIPKPPQGQIPLPPPLNGPTPPPFTLDLSMANIPKVANDNPQVSREQELNSIKLKKVEVNEEAKSESMYDQIKNIKLKAVAKKEPAQIITKNEKNYLQSSLAAAIQQRRKNLMKHQEESDSEDEDW